MSMSFANLPHSTRQVVAVVEEVLPTVGLAYAVDDTHRRWAVTRSTSGSCFQSLDEGCQVALTISQHDDFELASACALLT